MERVLAFSGGIDSTALLAKLDITRCVYVDYGQPAAEAECAASSKLAERFDVPWHHVIVRGWPLGSMADPIGEEGLRIVPARNLMLASCCAAYAMPAGAIYFGAHQGDEAYPDCRLEFFSGLSSLMQIVYGVDACAPNLERTKSEILADLASVLRDYDFACWSCYTPRAGEGDQLKPCGTCTSCQERQNA